MRTIVNAVLVRQGSVLLARRSPRCTAYPGLWSFPGGHVEAGETPDQALIREAREEIAIVPVVYAAMAQIADPATASRPAIYHMYVVSEWTGEARIADDEHTALRWFSFQEARSLPALALEEYRALFDRLRLSGR